MIPDVVLVGGVDEERPGAGRIRLSRNPFDAGFAARLGEAVKGLGAWEGFLPRSRSVGSFVNQNIVRKLVEYSTRCGTSR